MRFKRIECLGEGISGLKNDFFEDGWKLSQSKIKNNKTKGQKKNERITDIFEAKVPGNVRLTLLENGIISDPFIGMNNEKSKWISEVDWDYFNSLKLNPWVEKIQTNLKNGGIIHTIFDAIDYDASFYIDNKSICRQTGMFSPIDLITGITNEKENIQENIPLQVHFYKQPWWRTHALKSQMAFGWDFAPEIRTIGIWNHVRIQYTGCAFFTELFVISKGNGRNKHVEISGIIRILEPNTLNDILGSQEINLNINLNGEIYNLPAKIESGKKFEIKINNVELPEWNPWNLGKPSLTPIKIKLSWNNDITDEYRGNVINRKIEWARNPGTFPKNENWTLKVNDKKMFVRGINWVPPDSLYGRISKEKYEKLIDLAIEMNIDMFRVWGGGIEEKSSFYDLCDEKGMMVWQEYPFACTNYPKDPRYTPIANIECRNITKRTRRHPSLVVYCGGNEFNNYINSHIIKIVKNAVRDYADDRYCFAASPLLGDDHNWRVWGMGRHIEAYDLNGTNTFQMLTEYGMQAAPNFKTLAECAAMNNNEKLTDFNNRKIENIKEFIRYHKGDLNNHQKYADHYNSSISDVKSFIKVSQSLQAYSLKYAIEKCRSAWPNVSGVFPWQLSDPWPNISWSVVDYNLRPKMAFEMLKRSYAPILPIMGNWRSANKNRCIRKGDLIIHNASQESFMGNLSIEIQKTKELSSNSSKNLQFKNLNIKPNRPLRITTLELEVQSGTKIDMSLFDNSGNLIVKNFSYPAMEPNKSILRLIKDWVDIRFDGWWRKYMTKLMEQERNKEDQEEWTKKLKERAKF